MLLVYSFFSFVFGQNGLYTRKHLEAELSRLSENRQALELANQNILKIKKNLMQDQDTLSVYTRQLGYGRENEKFIRIKGLNVAAHSGIHSGQVLYAVNPDYISDKLIKIIAICFGAVVLAFFIIRDLLF